MNNTFRLGLVAGLAFVGFQAAAQSSQPASFAQIYGGIGAGVTYKNHVTGGGHSVDMTNSLLSSSWIGFRGREDLGGGLGAQFRIESGLRSNSGVAGSGGKFWDRQAFVGLDWNRIATLTVGRQFSASTDRVVQSLDVYNVAGPSLDTQPLAVFGVNRYAGNDTRVDNSVKLRLNGPAGTTLGTSVGLNDGTGRNYSFDLSQLTRNYTVGLYGTRYEAATRIAATGARPIHQAYGIGAQLPIGSAAAVYLNFTRSTLEATVAARPRQDNTLVSLGARYTYGAVTLKGLYVHDRGDDLNNVVGRDGKKQTFVTSAEYGFSRNTSAYVAVFQNRFSDGYRLEALNIAGLNRDPAASSMTGYSVGFRQAF